MNWKKREDIHNLVVSAIVPKTEFLECKRNLHLPDKSDLNSSDKLAKVRLVFNAINKQYIFHYQPTQHVSVDKTMVPYFGKHEAKQYIHGKPFNFGYYLWVVVTPLGYCI